MTLPNSWDKISLEQYAKIRRISKIEPQSDIERLDNLIKIVQVVMNCDQDTAEKFTLKEIEVFNEFLKSPVGTTIVKHFKVNKTFFEIELNPNNLSAWRHAGVMNALKDVDANMHLIIFSLARPYKWIAGVKKKYFELKESEIPDVVLAINQLPVSLAYPLIVFFFQSLKRTHELFPRLFRKQVEGDEPIADNSKNELTERYGWFKTIKDVSEQLKEGWDVTGERNVIDYLGKLEYLIIENQVKIDEYQLQKALNGK